MVARIPPLALLCALRILARDYLSFSISTLIEKAYMHDISILLEAWLHGGRHR
jgi:hypothetical protein